MKIFLILIIICYTLCANGERHSEFRLENILKGSQIGQGGRGGGIADEDKRVNQFPEVSDDLVSKYICCIVLIKLIKYTRFLHRNSVVILVQDMWIFY